MSHYVVRKQLHISLYSSWNPRFCQSSFVVLTYRCLDVPIFERGYGKDAAAICREALSHAKMTGADVVLIDTAGRMQVCTMHLRGPANNLKRQPFA